MFPWIKGIAAGYRQSDRRTRFSHSVYRLLPTPRKGGPTARSLSHLAGCERGSGHADELENPQSDWSGACGSRFDTMRCNGKNIAATIARDLVYRSGEAELRSRHDHPPNADFEWRVRDGGQWKIDDIRGSSDGEPWSIRAMLSHSLKN
jgi:hypothetical protein